MAEVDLDLGPLTVNITRIWRGDLRRLGLIVKQKDLAQEDPDAAPRIPFDLTGKTFLCQVRASKDSSSPVLLTLDVTVDDDPTTGKVSIGFQFPDDHPAKSFYDMEISNFIGDQPFTMVEGQVSVAGQRSIAGP